MKIISGKSIFSFLIAILIMSFVINNLLSENQLLNKKKSKINSPTSEEKIIGVTIRQQNKKGENILIEADSLQEVNSKIKKVILENSFTTIDQNGVLTTISAGHAIISNNYDNFNFSDKVTVNKKLRKFTLETKSLNGALKKGNFYTNDDVNIVSGNTMITGKGLIIKKNGEYIKVEGKAILNMVLLNKND